MLEETSISDLLNSRRMTSKSNTCHAPREKSAARKATVVSPENTKERLAGCIEVNINMTRGT